MNITDQEGTAWSAQTLSLCMTEPAFFFMQLFSASGDLVARGRIKPELCLWLRGETVRSLNEALSDPGRVLSTAVILAVGRIALHEALYGDREAARLVHRPAYLRMLARRGGADAMGLPPLTIRLMEWAAQILFALCGPPMESECEPIIPNNQIGHNQQRLDRIALHAINQYVSGTVKEPQEQDEEV